MDQAIRTDESVYPPQDVLDKAYVIDRVATEDSASDDPQLDQGQVG